MKQYAESKLLVLAGQIGYALVPMIARGVMLGLDQPVILHMLDIPPAAEALNGVKMELVDAAFPLLKGRKLLILTFHSRIRWCIIVPYNMFCNLCTCYMLTSEVTNMI